MRPRTAPYSLKLCGRWLDQSFKMATNETIAPRGIRRKQSNPDKSRTKQSSAPQLPPPSAIIQHWRTDGDAPQQSIIYRIFGCLSGPEGYAKGLTSSFKRIPTPQQLHPACRAKASRSVRFPVRSKFCFPKSLSLRNSTYRTIFRGHVKNNHAMRQDEATELSS